MIGPVGTFGNGFGGAAIALPIASTEPMHVNAANLNIDLTAGSFEVVSHWHQHPKRR